MSTMQAHETANLITSGRDVCGRAVTDGLLDWVSSFVASTESLQLVRKGYI